ncbi:MAG: preprotein translocase subunit SecY [Xanthobacteraceae bacterium]
MTDELRRRIAFTLGALLISRVGSHIPLPGIDLSVWTELFRSQPGGAMEKRLAIFSIGIMPYVTAAILIQLVMMVSKRLRALHDWGEQGRRTIVQYTLYLTVVLAAFQAYGIAIGLEAVDGLVAEPRSLFRIITVMTLIGGTVFLAWLSEQITARGIGNGLALLLSLDIVLQFPSAVAATLDLGRRGLLPSGTMFGILVIAVALIGLMAFVELARRRVSVTYPRRPIGLRMVEGQSHLVLKLNAAGAVIPAMFASWLLVPVLAVATFGAGQGWWGTVASFLGPGRPLYLFLYAVAIVVGVLLYTAFLLGPEQLAEKFQQYGGVVAGIQPGEATAAYLDHVLSRTALVGALYLALVCLIPEILTRAAVVPFYFSGPSLLILVCTIMDVEAQARAHAPIRVRGE